MSTTTSNLLSNQWISYGSWMLFKSKYLPHYFRFHFTRSLNVVMLSLVSIFAFSHHIVGRRGIIINIMKYNNETKEKKLFNTFLLFFFSCFRFAFGDSCWAENESNYRKYFKRSFLTQVFQRKKPWALWQNGYTIGNVFICFIVMSFVADGFKNMLPSDSYVFGSFIFKEKQE